MLSGCIAVAKVLIDAGADVNAKGCNGNTPLILAANGGQADIARLLLNHPNIDIHDQVSSYNAKLQALGIEVFSSSNCSRFQK